MPNPWDEVLKELAVLQAQIAMLKAWKEQVEAEWPQIAEVDDVIAG